MLEVLTIFFYLDQWLFTIQLQNIADKFFKAKNGFKQSDMQWTDSSAREKDVTLLHIFYVLCVDCDCCLFSCPAMEEGMIKCMRIVRDCVSRHEGD